MTSTARRIEALTDAELDTAIWAKRGLLDVAHGEGREDVEAELAALLAEQAGRAEPTPSLRAALADDLAGALASLAYVTWGPGRGFDQPEGSQAPDGLTWVSPSKIRALLDRAAREVVR
jgi:hypothetical protein